MVLLYNQRFCSYAVLHISNSKHPLIPQCRVLAVIVKIVFILAQVYTKTAPKIPKLCFVVILLYFLNKRGMQLRF